jgi:hypothetical protein
MQRIDVAHVNMGKVAVITELTRRGAVGTASDHHVDLAAGQKAPVACVRPLQLEAEGFVDVFRRGLKGSYGKHEGKWA